MLVVHRRRTAPMATLPPPPKTETLLDVLAGGQELAHALIERYNALRSGGARAIAARTGLARRLCAELAVQLQIEEELLYPELRESLPDPAPVDQAEVENACMRALVERLIEMSPTDPSFDARVVVLGELLERHLARAARELYPLAMRVPLDPRTLGLALVQRRDELLADLADGHVVPLDSEAVPGDPAH